MEDRRRLAGAHHGELGGRPGEADVVAHPLRVHHDVRAAIALAQDHAQPRHGRPGVGEHQLRPVADHASPLEVLAGVEARRVDERHEAEVEGVAEGHEAGRLLRRSDVERAGEGEWLVGDDADRPAADRRQRRHDVGRPAVAQLEQAAVVDDRCGDRTDVVAPGRGRRDQPGELRRRVGRSGRRTASAPDPRRRSTGDRRAGRRRLRSPRRGRRPRGWERRCGGRGWTAPPSSAVVICTPVNSVTIIGPLTKA